MRIFISVFMFLFCTHVWAEPMPEDVDFIVNYQKYDETTFTGGFLGDKEAGFKLKKYGFKSVIDMRTPKEGVSETRMDMEAAGLNYTNIPVHARNVFADETVQSFTEIYESLEKPVLIFCMSGNRVGTVWAQHRIQQGVPILDALKEGKKMGMKDAMITGVVDKLEH